MLRGMRVGSFCRLSKIRKKPIKKMSPPDGWLTRLAKCDVAKFARLFCVADWVAGL
jgi:hypothetical protein